MLYRLVPGGGVSSYGIRVAALAGLPPHLVSSAASKSRAMERQALQQRRELAACNICADGSDTSLKQLASLLFCWPAIRLHSEAGEGRNLASLACIQRKLIVALLEHSNV